MLTVCIRTITDWFLTEEFSCPGSSVSCFSVIDSGTGWFRGKLGQEDLKESPCQCRTEGRGGIDISDMCSRCSPCGCLQRDGDNSQPALTRLGHRVLEERENRVSVI